MPGRQSTAAPRPSMPKAQKKQKQNQKRSLNALATASQRVPDTFKIRPQRLGKAEQDNAKRKRPKLEGGGGGGMRTSKRQRAGAKDRFGNEIEGGSDSDGNEWTLGHVDTDDESDLDSDKAMGTSDEERFEGFTFRGSSQKKPPVIHKATVGERRNLGNELHGIDLEEDDGEHLGSGIESDEFGEDAVDLVTMLDTSEDEGKELPRLVSKVEGQNTAADNPPSVLEDQAIDAESSIVEQDQGSELFISEDEASADNNAKLSALQNLVSSISADQSISSPHRLPLHHAQENVTPSDFGLSPRQKLTVADLLPSVIDTRLKKSLKLMSNDVAPKASTKRIPGKLEVPLAKRQQDRLERAAAYGKSKEVLNRWIDTVKRNRRAEHLSFPLRDPDLFAANGTNRLPSTAHTKPLTDLESTIQSILRESGLAPTGNKSQENQLQAFEELQTNKLPLEEVQARRAELRKARELMFREEIRAKRIKKIKSKSYRRVHKKEREKIAGQERGTLAAAGVDLSGNEQEQNDRRRAEERMGARHRESKWARSVKATGRAVWDDDARNGVLEMANREEDLRRMVLGKDMREEREESVSSSTESENEDDISDEHAECRGRERLYRRLEQPNQSRKTLGSGGNGATSTLTSMRFMQKAEAARKQQNDADVEELRRGLNSSDDESDVEVKEGTGRRSYQPASAVPTHALETDTVNENEFEARAGSDDENSKVGEAGDLEVTFDYVANKKSISPRGNVNVNDQRFHHRRDSNQLGKEVRSDVVENPWLSAGTKMVKHGTIKDRQARALITATPDMGALTASKPGSKSQRALKAPSMIMSDPQNVKTTDKRLPLDRSESELETEETYISSLVIRNQELVRQAFAGDEVVADFEKEKLQTVQDEEEKVVDNTIPGWGSWTGTGISKKELKRSKGRFLTKEAGIKEEHRKDARLARVIINEKRVKKVEMVISNLYAMLILSRISDIWPPTCPTPSRPNNSTRGPFDCL